MYALTNKKAEIDLSLSENPYKVSSKVTRVIKSLVKKVNSYPDPNLPRLRKILAKKFDLRKDQFIFGTGSEQLIDLSIRVFAAKKRVLIPELTFPFLLERLKLNRSKIKFIKMDKNLRIDLKDLQEKLKKNIEMVILCNPNNPTGSVVNPQKLINLIKQNTNELFFIDEANIEFGGESLTLFIKGNPNLMISRTFSKAFGLAGLRIGFLAANKKLIKKLQIHQTPFPVNLFAEGVAVAALKDEMFLQKTNQLIKKERMFLEKELQKRGFKVFPSVTNNLLIKSDISDITRRLFEMGVSVVGGENFGLGSNFFRIAIKNKKTNRGFLKQLDILLDRLNIDT